MELNEANANADYVRRSVGDHDNAETLYHQFHFYILRVNAFIPGFGIPTRNICVPK